MRLPVDWRRPLSDSGAGQFRPDRPLPVGARDLGVAQELGPDAPGGLTASQWGRCAHDRGSSGADDLRARHDAAYMAIGRGAPTRLSGAPRLIPRRWSPRQGRPMKFLDEAKVY